MEFDYISCGDCLKLMKNIPDNSIDMILCDLPYGSTRNKWDFIIPFDLLWKSYERIIKDNGVIVLFCDGMFTAQLLNSNPKLWRYNLIWDKQRGCEVVNPTKNKENSYKSYIDTGLKQLMNCDAIYMLLGYENSKGALLELHYAKVTGLKIFNIKVS